jgi:hypothetical protein
MAAAEELQIADHGFAPYALRRQDRAAAVARSRWMM